MSDFISFLKKIKSIFEREYTCSVFTFVQYIFFSVSCSAELIPKKKKRFIITDQGRGKTKMFHDKSPNPKRITCFPVNVYLTFIDGNFSPF